MDNPELRDTVKRLEREIAAWDQRDEEREVLPELVPPGYGVGGAAERLRILLPIVLRRAGPGIPAAAVRAVDAAREALAVMREWLSTDIPSLDPSERPSSYEARADRALETVRAVARELRKQQVGRDLGRLAGDVEILAGWLGSFADEARRRAGFPPAPGETWTLERWTQFLRRTLAVNHPAIAAVEKFGLSDESLARAWSEETKQGRQIEDRGEDMVERHREEGRRARTWDGDNPELFLDLPELPEPPEDDGEEEPKEAWAESLDIPDLEEVPDPLEAQEGEAEDEPAEDPVFEQMHEFTIRVLGESKKAGRTPLDHYLVSIVLGLQSLYFKTDEEDATSRCAWRAICAEHLGRFAQAAERLGEPRHRGLAAEARELAARARREV